MVADGTTVLSVKEGAGDGMGMGCVLGDPHLRCLFEMMRGGTVGEAFVLFGMHGEGCDLR